MFSRVHLIRENQMALIDRPTRLIQPFQHFSESFMVTPYPKWNALQVAYISQPKRLQVIRACSLKFLILNLFEITMCKILASFRDFPFV